MKTTSTPESTKPPRISKLKAYEELRWPTTDKFFVLRAYVMGALALLEASDVSEKCEHVINAVRILISVGEDALRFAEEVDGAFADAGMGHHD